MNQTELQNYLESTLAELLNKLEIDAVINVEQGDSEEEKQYFNVNLEVENGSHELIGRYGSMLESLTTVLNAILATKSASSDLGSWRVVLDVNNYRKERSEYIEEVAGKAVSEVVDTGLPVSLDPMKPWERRLVHMIASRHPEVATESSGEGYNRHVVISPA